MAKGQKEIVLEEDVCGEKGIAALAGWISRKLQWIGRRGAPDRLLAKPFNRPCPHCGTRGRVVLIEFKRRGERPDGQQQKEIDRLRNAGIEVYVIDNFEDAQDVVENSGPRSV